MLTHNIIIIFLIRVLLFRAIGKLRSESSRGRNTECVLLSWSAWLFLASDTGTWTIHIFLCRSFFTCLWCDLWSIWSRFLWRHSDLKVSILTSHSAHSYLHFFSAIVFLSIVGDTVEELMKASMSLHCSVVTKHLSFKAAPSQPVTWKEFTHLVSKKVIYATGLGRFSK